MASMEPAPNVVQPAHQTRTAVRSGVVSPPASFPKDGPCLTGDPVIDNTKFALSSLSSHDRMIRMIEDVTAANSVALASLIQRLAEKIN